MPGNHARLSASGAKKWLACPLSVTLEEQMPEVETQYAEEGTNAHALGEAKLRHALCELTRVQYHKRIADIDTDPDMEEYTDGYRDFVLERYADALARSGGSAEVYLEQRLDMRNWVPEGFGTGDAVIVCDGQAEIIDLKYGQGVRVDAENNPQLRLYALGVLAGFDWLYDIKSVRMTIYQPRIDNISCETLTAEELLKWGAWVRGQARYAYDGIGETCAGKHCESGFCRARPVCRAYKDYKMKLAAMDFAKPATLTEEEIAEVMDQAKGLIAWADSVKAYALKQALNGAHYPGYKLVEGRSNRKYTDEAAIFDKLTKAGFAANDIHKPSALLNITDMEKLLGKARFNELLSGYIVKPPGAPTLVPSEDKRPEWNGAENDFKDFIEKE